MYGAVCPFCRLAHGGTKSSPPHLAGTTMHKLAIAAALATALGSTTARAEFLSCDTFMKRLQDAGRVLTFPLPPAKIERNPYVTDSDAFWVSYAYPDDEVHEGSLGCSRGHIDDYQMDLDHFAR